MPRLGTTDWSLDLTSLLGTNAPGAYQLTVFAQDGAGNSERAGDGLFH